MASSTPQPSPSGKTRRIGCSLVGLGAVVAGLVLVIELLNGSFQLLNTISSFVGQHLRSSNPTPTATVPLPTATATPLPGAWSVTLSKDTLEIAYGSNDSFSQYSALDLASGYLRLDYGPGSGWGTSVVLLPSFWTTSTTACGHGGYCQGAPVQYNYSTEGSALILHLTGTIGGLSVVLDITFDPPSVERATAHVNGTITSGTVPLDTKSRPWEAFKPVMLSSMHISQAQWDASSAQAAGIPHPLPPSGWIIQPPVDTDLFGLVGGTSSWKVNAPTVEIQLNAKLQVTGWVTPDNMPADENVGLWAATDHQLSSWSYQIVATKAA